MKLREAVLWEPQRVGRAAFVAAGILLVSLVAWLHYISGLSYEFHLLFILPVLFVAWFVGAASGYGMAFLSAILWYAADKFLQDEMPDILPHVFNNGMRLTIFLMGVWLLRKMRTVLDREARLASEDTLTGLPNRREFYEQGKRALAQSRRDGKPFSAVFIDLDHFKDVNDTLGHETGDQLLNAVALGLRAHLRVSDIPGRLGGDEFALLLPGMNGESVARYVEDLRQRLLALMREQDWPVTFSIGIASYCEPPERLDQLMAKADDLMYEVKNGGRDNVLIRECGR